MALTVLADSSAATDSRTLTWTIPTLAAGDVVVVTAVTWDTANTLNAPTGTGLTFTQRVSFSAASKARLYIWTAVAASGGSSVVVTCSVLAGGASVHNGVLYRCPTADGYSLGATPNTSTASGTVSAAQTSLTGTSGNLGIVAAGDWNGVTGHTSGQWVPAGTVDDLAVVAAGDSGQYFAHATLTGTSTTLGITGPTAGTSWVAAAIEVLKTGGGPGLARSQAESVTAADTVSKHSTLARSQSETVHLADATIAAGPATGGWWHAVAAAAAGTGRARYVVVGDSYVEGIAASNRASTFTAKLAGDIRTAHTIAGSGIGLLNFDDATSHTGTVAADDSQTQSAGAHMTGTASALWTITGASFDVVYRETPGAAVITVKVDGTTVGTITHPGSGSNVQSKSWNHVIGTGGSHTVQVLTTDAQYVDGVVPYNGDTAAVGVSFIKCGRSGSMTDYWTDTFPNARQGWNQFAPDLVIVEPTINDCLNDIPVATTAANVAAQVTYALALPSAPTVLYIAPFFTNYAPFFDDGSATNGLGLKLDAYRTAALAAAAAAGALTLDLRVAIPDPVGDSLLDTGHPNDAGHAAYAQAISDFLDANAPSGTSRSQSDSVTLSDTVSAKVTRARGLAESVTAGDTTASASTRARATSDSVTAADTTGRQLAAARAVSDGAALPDVTAPSQLGNLTRSQSDGVTAADGQARALAQARAAADSAGVGDAVVRRLARFRSLSDALTAGETTARTLAESRALNDAVTLSDTTSASSAGNLARGVSDSLTVADAIARRIQAARSVTEPLQVADALAAASTRARATTEAFTATDVLTRSLGRARSLAETVTANDTTARGALVLGRAVVEPVTLVDLAAAGAVQARALLEQLQLGDVTVGSVFDPSTLRDITISASLVRAWAAALAPRTRDAELTDRSWRATL